MVITDLVRDVMLTAAQGGVPSHADPAGRCVPTSQLPLVVGTMSSSTGRTRQRLSLGSSCLTAGDDLDARTGVGLDTVAPLPQLNGFADSGRACGIRLTASRSAFGCSCDDAF